MHRFVIALLADFVMMAIKLCLLAQIFYRTGQKRIFCEMLSTVGQLTLSIN